MGVIEVSEYLSFCAKPDGRIAVQQLRSQNFHRDGLRILFVNSVGEEHGTHAASADPVLNFPHTDFAVNPWIIGFVGQGSDRRRDGLSQRVGIVGIGAQQII